MWHGGQCALLAAWGGPAPPVCLSVSLFLSAPSLAHALPTCHSVPQLSKFHPLSSSLSHSPVYFTPCLPVCHYFHCSFPSHELESETMRIGCHIYVPASRQYLAPGTSHKMAAERSSANWEPCPCYISVCVMCMPVYMFTCGCVLCVCLCGDQRLT